MDDVSAKPAKTDRDIYDRIWTAIAEHQLVPGTRLKEEELAEIFAASRAKVRQALQNLARDGLVTLVPNRGAVVSKPSIEEARDVFFARRTIEERLVERLCAIVDGPGVARLKAHVDGVWIADDELLPRNWHAGVLFKNWTRGEALRFDKLIDNCYTGFRGRAEIFEGPRMTHALRASPDCHWLHIYVPQGEDFFCAEPVNHMPDPFNQPNSGMKCLKAGETRMVWMDIGLT